MTTLTKGEPTMTTPYRGDDDGRAPFVDSLALGVAFRPLADGYEDVTFHVQSRREENGEWSASWRDMEFRGRTQAHALALCLGVIAATMQRAADDHDERKA